MKSGYYVFCCDDLSYLGFWDVDNREMLAIRDDHQSTWYLEEIDEIVCGPFEIEDLLTKFPKYEENK